MPRVDAEPGRRHPMPNCGTISAVMTTEDGPQVAEATLRPVLADAVAQARSAAEELGRTTVGEHLGVRAEPDSVGAAATHRFAAALPGYRGWEWSVVVAAAPDAESATVSEVVLLPGPDALVSPVWLPWEERVRAGDLGPGDLLPPPADDPRLVPGYLVSDDPAVQDVARDVGLGRRQVLSREGRLDAAQRWFDGPRGPLADVAVAVSLQCGTCGFYLPLAGSLRAAFGVCGNEFADDGQVVHVEHGCGAHSDTVVAEMAATPVSALVHDDSQLDVVVTGPASPDPDPDPEAQGAAGEPIGIDEVDEPVPAE